MPSPISSPFLRNTRTGAYTAPCGYLFADEGIKVENISECE